MTRYLLALTLILGAATAFAKPEPFGGTDYSGVYDCTGLDDHEGEYTGTVTLTRIPAQSSGPYGAYRFQLEVPGYGIYSGQAAVRGTNTGVHFALADQSTKDYGTGIAQFRQDKSGKWAFRKYYYEPEFKGGNFGVENCVMQ